MSVSLRQLIVLLVLSCPSFEALDEKGVRGMMDLERDLLKGLRDYAEKLQEKISLINSSLEEYTEEIEEAKQDPEEYLSNPLNAFRLIRHMHQDWASWQVYMEEQVGVEQIAKMERLLPQIPQKGHFKKAARNVDALARFYDYKPSELVAKNELTSALHLSPLDCYHLGLELYGEHDYLGAAKWLEVAAQNYTLSKYSDLYETLGAPRWQVYRDWARTLSKLNRGGVLDVYATALLLTSQYQNVHLLHEVSQFELLSLRDPMDPILDPEPHTSALEHRCRGKAPPREEGMLCENNDWVTPFLVLAPLKYEMLVRHPFTIFYPDSIFESEIEHVEKAHEGCPKRSRFELTEGISGCSISDGFSPVFQRIKERVLDMTGMNEAFKSFYVVEYSQTRPFELFKLFRNSSKFPKLNAKDLEDVEATAIIFLKDLTLGGAITKPQKDLLVQPKRGSVLITLKDTELDTTVCPNIADSGLVMIKFLLKPE